MYVPQFSAASTAARSSASVKVVTSIGLKGDDTPPPAVNLTWEAPCMSCSRVRRRTSSGLSATMLAAKLLHAGEHAADRPRQIG